MSSNTDFKITKQPQLGKSMSNSIRNNLDLEEIFSQSKKSYNKTESDIILSEFPSNNNRSNNFNENNQEKDTKNESLLRFDNIFNKALKPYSSITQRTAEGKFYNG